MGLLEDMDQRAKKLSFIDLLLGEGSAILFGLFIASLIPQIMSVNMWWLMALAVLFHAKASCVFWFKK